MPLVLCLEEAVDEFQRGGQVLLERRLDLLRRQDESAGLRRVGPKLDGKRRDGVLTVGLVCRITHHWNAVKLRGLQRPIGRTMHVAHQLLHPLSKLCHGG
jgi:hypothetical protein